MKKNPINLLMICTATVLISLSSCVKSKTPETPVETATMSDDQSQFSTEIDAVTDEANALITENGANFRTSSAAVCDATVQLDTTATTKTLTITYNNSNCLAIRNRTRSGTVIMSMPRSVRWADAGAELSIEFINVKITRISDKKSITLNGRTLITNLTGGTIVGLSNAGSMAHTITSDSLSVKFPDGTSRIWHVAKRRDFTYDNGIVVSTTGIRTEGNVHSISEWGLNRNGESFYTTISQPMIIRQDCGFRLTAGKVDYVTNIKLSITFGLDMNGAPTTCPGAGHYFFKAEYTDLRSITHSVIWPY